MVFKLLLISAVVEPDTLDLLILLSWYTLLSFLRSLAHLEEAGHQREEQMLRRLRYYIQKEEVGQGTEGMSMKG